jgi:ABC-2 type transport system permease protein
MALLNRVLDWPTVRRSRWARTFLTATWLGWQIESNWARPALFAIYAIARPLSSALILVIMYSVITDGATGEPLFAYIYIGNALYILVGGIIAGVSWSVVDDREHYRTIKQLYTSPISGYAYLMGRGTARLVISLISVLITLVFGWVSFQLPIDVAAVNWPLFIATFVIGVAGMSALGLILGCVTMQMARHFWSVGDSVSAAMYLFVGAIFPLDVLPVFLRWVGFLLPVTYWLELMRRALLGSTAPAFATFAMWSDIGLLGMLVLMTTVLVAISGVVFRWALHQAKEKGIMDMESSY